MHAVVSRVVDLDRQEGSRSDMQGDVVQADAARLEIGEKLRGEMQSGGRRRDRSVFARIDRLVVAAVTIILGALGGDVGRKGHHARLGDRTVEVGAG